MKWEYKIINAKTCKEEEDALAEYGSNGWRLIKLLHCETMVALYFEREFKESETSEEEWPSIPTEQTSFTTKQ